MHNIRIQYINRVAFTEAHQGDFASNFLRAIPIKFNVVIPRDLWYFFMRSTTLHFVYIHDLYVMYKILMISSR